MNVDAEQVTLRLPEPIVAEDRRGYDHMNGETGAMWPAEQCGRRSPWDGAVDRGCDKPFQEGDHVRKVRGLWLHAECARAEVTAADVDQAWLLIADQVAARPHKFRASDIRTVMRAVSAIAARASASPRGGDPA